MKLLRRVSGRDGHDGDVGDVLLGRDHWWVAGETYYQTFWSAVDREYLRHLARPFWAIEDRYGRWGFLVPTSDGKGWTRIRFFTQARANTSRALLSKCGEIPGYGLVHKR